MEDLATLYIYVPVGDNYELKNLNELIDENPQQILKWFLSVVAREGLGFDTDKPLTKELVYQMIDYLEKLKIDAKIVKMEGENND